MEYELRVYETARGKRPFSQWLANLKDREAKANIRIRLERLAMGNFGNCKSLGNGIKKLKIDIGPGYRIYFGQIGGQLLLLLMGGSKRDQQNDIEKAIEYFRDYKIRGK